MTSALSALEREYKFWMTEGQHAVTVVGHVDAPRGTMGHTSEDDTLTYPHRQKAPAAATSWLFLAYCTCCCRQQTTPGGEDFVLNRYYTSSSGPRPESYKEDVSTRLEAVRHGVPLQCLLKRRMRPWRLHRSL